METIKHYRTRGGKYEVILETDGERSNIHELKNGHAVGGHTNYPHSQALEAFEKILKYSAEIDGIHYTTKVIDTERGYK